ncbi:MAG: LD-carboxypeptidase, partial [Gaiellales bacterium]
MSLRKPPALHSGDRLAIVAPASPFDREAFDRGLAELRSLGFDVTHDDTIFARRGYVAGEPAARAASVTRAWSDPTVAGIVCARGGYGSVQCLPHLDFAAMGATPKVFVGYSDLTSLLTCFTQSSGIVVFHGPTVVGRFSEGSAAYDSRTFLSATMATVPLGEVYAPSLECVGGGDASGPLTGGTLTQLVASLGTPFAFDPPAGSVLFL